VFSLKYNPSDENFVVSGGWDNTIQVCTPPFASCLWISSQRQIWDLRLDHSVRSIFGPHICGDAVDIRGDTLLSGSWRPKDALQLWDLGSGRLIDSFRWDVGLGEPQTMLYAACFNGDGSLAAAGGSENNEARVYNVKSGEVRTCRDAGCEVGGDGVRCRWWAPCAASSVRCTRSTSRPTARRWRWLTARAR
jgi:WD40 repeat protein